MTDRARVHGASNAYGAEMKTFVRLLLVGTMLLARCAWATEPSPVAVAKSVVSERGSQPLRP
jgi:hypothetical protein